MNISLPRILNYIRVIWLYTKFQLVAKLILAIIIYPLFKWFTEVLLSFSGKTNLTSGDYLSFLFSANGFIFLILAFIIVVFIIGIDTNALIVLCALIHEHKLKLTLKEVFIASIKSLKYFISLAGIVLVIYIGILLPLVSIGFSLTPFRSFKIPNFITEVIFNNHLYLTLYIFSLIVLTILSFIYIFTLHYIIISRLPIGQALRKSQQLICKHWRQFLKGYLGTMLKLIVGYAVILIVVAALAFMIGSFFKQGEVNHRAWLIFIITSIAELVSFIIFLQIPISIQIVTNLFYKFNQQDNYPVKFDLTKRITLDHKIETETDTTISLEELTPKTSNNSKENSNNITNIESNDYLTDDRSESSRHRTNTYLKSLSFKKLIIQIGMFLGVIFSCNVAIAYYTANHFDEIFAPSSYPQIIAHRAGGDLGAENTVQALEQAIKYHANWAEFDVQRTKDGYYIINHDKTFKRLSGVDTTPAELTLAQIQQLRVTNEFDPNEPAQPIATVPQFLDTAKNKIGLFMELKGATADPQMARDMITQIEAKHMLNQVVLISLNYPLIEYISQHYPQVQTGYLFFFNAGDLKNLAGNYLLMEEREATDSNIEYAHDIGKKVVVWTVDTEESIHHFIYSGVDGIITDDVLAVQQAIAQAKQRTDFDIIVDYFIE